MIALLYRDVWSPVWPNLAANVLWVPGGLWWHQSRMRRHVTAEVERMHNDMIRHFEREGTS